MIIRSIIAIGGIAWTAILGRTAGASMVGEFFIAFAILLGSNVLARMGSDSALLRFVGQEDDEAVKSALLKRAIVTTCGISSVLAVAIFLLRHWIEQIFAGAVLSDVLIGMSFALIPFSLMSVLMSFLKAQQRPEIATVFENGGVLGASGVFLLLWGSVGGSVDGASIGYCFFYGAAVCLITATSICFQWLRKAFTSVVQRNHLAVRDYVRSSFVYMSAELMSYVHFIGGTLIGGYLLTSHELGLLKASERVSSLLGFSLTVANNVIAPAIAQASNRDQVNELRSISIKATAFAVAVATPVLVIMLFFPKNVLMIFGEEFTAAANFLLLFAVAQFVNVISGPMMLILNMSGQARIARNITFVWGVFGLGLMPPLIEWYGTFGAVLSFAISMIGQNISASYCVYRYHGFTIYSLRK